MRKYALMVREIKENCHYLLDRESYMESIFGRIKKDIKLSQTSVTGVSGSGYDCRGIFCNCPPEFVAIFMNKDHAKDDFYSGHHMAAKELGYATEFFNDLAKNYPKDYEERYRRFGFKCGMGSIFCDQSGSVAGIWGALKTSGTVFTEDEMSAIRSLAPFVFYAFLRYRWLVQADFFTVVCFDEFPYGILTVDDERRITYVNEPARQLLKMADKSIPETLPQPLAAQMRRIEDIAKHKDNEPCLAFQEIETYVPPYGVTVCYRFDSTHGGKYLPVKGSGWVFFIDSRKKDMAQKALLSPRELEVIRLVGCGLQDKEIAHELGISEKTVQTYMHNLFAKLETQNRTEAAVKAIRLGLL